MSVYIIIKLIYKSLFGRRPMLVAVSLFESLGGWGPKNLVLNFSDFKFSGEQLPFFFVVAPFILR